MHINIRYSCVVCRWMNSRIWSFLLSTDFVRDTLKCLWFAIQKVANVFRLILLSGEVPSLGYCNDKFISIYSRPIFADCAYFVYTQSYLWISQSQINWKISPIKKRRINRNFFFTGSCVIFKYTKNSYKCLLLV